MRAAFQNRMAAQGGIPSPQDVAEQLIVFSLAVGFMVLLVMGALLYGAWWAMTCHDLVLSLSKEAPE